MTLKQVYIVIKADNQPKLYCVSCLIKSVTISNDKNALFYILDTYEVIHHHLFN